MVLSVLFWSMTATAAAAAPVQVTLRCHEVAPQGCSVAGLLYAVPVGGRERAETTPVEVRLSGPGTVTLPLAAKEVWELSVRAPGWWGRTVPVYVAGAGAEAALDIWPESRLEGTLEVPHGESLPSELSLRFGAPVQPRLRPDGTVVLPGGSPEPSGEVVCAVGDARFSCALPAARLDLKLRARSFISHFYWARSLPARGVLELGPVSLQPGASLIGFVTSAEGPAEPGKCTVTLTPVSAGVPPLAELPRGRARAESTTIDDRGFFAFDGIAPGLYEIEAKAPGFAATRLPPMEVRERTEASLRHAIVLERPAELVVAVRPPRDVYEKPWAVEVQALQSARDEVNPLFTTPVDADGRVRRQGIPVGTYRAVLHDSAGAPFMERVFDLTPTSAPVELEPQLVPVRGRALLGDRPLAAELSFGGHRALVRVPMVSGDDGRFDGVLPRQGQWRVEVEAEQPRLHRTLPSVEVKLSPSLGFADVEVHLPDTRLHGTVVDEAGAPVEGATVQAVDATMTPPSRVPSDAAGEFEFAGVAIGLARVSARDVTPSGPRSSAIQVVAVPEHGEPAPIRLVLVRSTDVVVHVAGEGGEPVPGAMVFLLPRPLQVMIIPQGTTDGSGTARLEAPAASRDWDAVFMATGYALQAAALHVEGPTALTVGMVRYGGALEVDLPAPLVWDDPSGPRLYLQWDAFLLEASLLFSWASTNGEPVDVKSRHFSFPAMGEGNYKVCLLTGAAVLGGPLSAGTRPAPCAAGFLPPLGRLILSIAASP